VTEHHDPRDTRSTVTGARRKWAPPLTAAQAREISGAFAPIETLFTWLHLSDLCLRVPAAATPATAGGSGAAAISGVQLDTMATNAIAHPTYLAGVWGAAGAAVDRRPRSW
jgi:hypothetical protein